MNYQETLDYLFNSMPMFQQTGSSAYKAGLDNTYTLDEYFQYPHKNYRTIHIAGTNGKGTCSHTLAATLQSAGYTVGLYTSPHLLDFNERIRINGRPVLEDYIIQFVEKHRYFFEPLYPSFFELTTAMAFRYFADMKVDVAIIEVGLGGRLDCTNVIRPDLSIITNISYDHVAQLGNALEDIAREKAGIIKPGIPVVIGETTEETRPVFLKKAEEVNAPVIFAEDEALLTDAAKDTEGYWKYQSKDYKDLKGELGGLYQIKNTGTLLSAIKELIRIGYTISETDVRNGFGNVVELTSLMGRWQKLHNNPTIICDTAHNIAGINYIVQQLSYSKYKNLHIVFGTVDDKDINGILALLPKNAKYYFTQASVKRALPVEKLTELAAEHGLFGEPFPDVVSAVMSAKQKSLPEDMIFVGGSNFIIADLLSGRDALDLY